ncbi:MAG TPA: N-6 DNA methylase, partial [Oscillatoriaceae cyanobacterium]
MKTRRTVFTAIDSQGALLPVELLQRIASLDKQDKDLRATLTLEAYGLAPSEKLADAINRSWQRLSGVWQGFQHSLGKLSAKDTAAQLTASHWLNVLFSELGYGQLPAAPVFMADDRPYGINHCFQHTPIHWVGARQGLDTPVRAAADHPKLSPHSLVQEWLNRSGDHLWGMVTNGMQLRLLRDNKSLTRQAFVEFDLEQIFSTDNYAEFAVFWLVCHQSRVAGERPEDCHLEAYTRLAAEQGVRLLDQLRGGVETAINELGAGFLAHKANGGLRAKLRSGALDKQDYYRQLLRLTYRLIFLLVAEARDALLMPEAPAEARERYNQYYSLARIRRIAEKRSGSAHGDLFEGLRLVMAKLYREGCPELALPALGSFLWSPEAIADLHEAQLSNQALLAAVRALTFTVDGAVRRLVDYKFLGPEELGSVYESLLELHPVLDTDLATFGLDVAAGHERKQTGSYYTPTSLIALLLDTALEPVIQAAIARPDPAQAILDLKVCDPACGSGHFLIAAAHRLAKRLAWVRTGSEEPAPAAYKHALHEVVRHCIYGVDINEMAVELCKVNLWLEALEPGKPLSFLDHHVQCGNSLLGATPALVSRGIPDAAIVALEGDDSQVVSAAKKSNKHERAQGAQLSFFGGGDLSLRHAEAVARAAQSVQFTSEESVDAVAAQAAAYETLVQAQEFKALKLRYDAWCAAFVWPRVKGPLPVMTQMLFEKVSEAPESLALPVREEIERLAEAYKFFHFPLAFPTVFRPKAE